MEKLGVDYYTGNLHKWAFATNGVALFYFAKGQNSNLHSPVTSWNHGQGFAKESAMLATRDYAPLLSAAAAVDFLLYVGLEKVRAHLKDEAWKAAELLKGMWGTRLGQPKELAAGMVTILLPAGISKLFSVPMDLRKEMRKWGFEMQTPLVVGGDWFSRISVPVWMEAREFIRFGEAILKVAAGGKL
jgi:isopenicillin-N epimerase